MDDSPSNPQRWKEHLPAVLILGSPAAAAGMMLSVAWTALFLVPEAGVVTVAAALILRLNLLLAPIGAAAGALRVGGTVSTRVAVTVASMGFAVAVYAAAVAFAATFMPGFDEQLGP